MASPPPRSKPPGGRTAFPPVFFCRKAPCRSKATAILKPGTPVTLPPAGNISFEIEKGQRFKLTQPQGEQVADLVSFNRDDTREILSMLTSRAVNLSYKFTAPMTLYSNLSREMWKIEEDLTGENYCGGGY